MKTKPIALVALVILVGMGTALAAGATNDVSSLLQKGLFEEEANHNLEAAISAYQAVVTQTEKDRQFAATAIFRLGECYRKLGRTNEATVQYQRILHEFPDQTELAKLSQSYIGTPTPVAAAGAQSGLQALFPDQETAELNRIQAMIKDSPDLINGQPGQNNVPLIHAVRNNWLTVVNFLLDNKADVNVREAGSSGSTAINIAAEQGLKEMVELLLARGADVNDTRSQYSAPNAPLHFAAEHGFKAIAEVLLARKADVNIKGRDDGTTPLHRAAKNGFMSLVELLLTNGANVGAQAGNGETPLHYAAKADNRAIMELLIAQKADVNARARNGATPLIEAAEASKLGAARLLLTNHADVNPKLSGGAKAGWMPLHYAVAYGQLELAKLLLDHNAEVDAPVSQYSLGGPFGGGGGGGGLSPSPGGFGGSRPGPGGFGGGRMGSSAYFNISPLAMAVITGNKDMVELLLDHKAAPNATDTNSDTPLSLAVKLNRYDIAEMLLARGAVADVQNSDHLSPLSLAVNNDQPQIVKLLLSHKPALEVTDNDFFTPLQRAVINNKEEIVELLLDAGASDVAHERDNGRSPLHWAVQQGYQHIVELLLAHHANPNIQDKTGNTPLSVAKQQLSNNADATTTQKRKDIVELLLKAGANDNLQRLTRIGVSRNGVQYNQVIYKGTNSFNQPTLFEMLADHYCPPTWYPRNMPGNRDITQPISEVPGLKFPDFGKIKISRLQKDGRTNTLNVDFESALNTGDCSKDIPLEWGDVVEIPESIHNVNETWTGLTDAVAGTLKKCLERKVSIVVRGATNQLILRPNHYVLQKRFISESGLTFERNPFTAMPEPSFNGGRGVPSTDTSLKTQLPSFWLYDVVHGANVILTSSDLTHVRVKRVNTTTHRAEQMTFDLTKKDLNNQLLLRDGDVVELPDKL